MRTVFNIFLMSLISFSALALESSGEIYGYKCYEDSDDSEFIVDIVIAESELEKNKSIIVVSGEKEGQIEFEANIEWDDYLLELFVEISDRDIERFESMYNTSSNFICEIGFSVN